MGTTRNSQMKSKELDIYKNKVKEMSNDELWKEYVEIRRRLERHPEKHPSKKINKYINHLNPRPTGYCCFCQNGREDEVYMQCLSCGQWDHEACTGAEPEKDYICPVCDPTQHKNAPGFEFRLQSYASCESPFQ